MNKPQTADKYSSLITELAERLLLEIWSHLGAYRNEMVLVGGLVPRYLIDQNLVQPSARHCGTMDVDLGVGLAVSNLETYRSIRSTIAALGFRPGRNERGNEQLHSFVKEFGDKTLNVDFLTTKYEGPRNSLMREVQKDLRAIQVEGLGLALQDPIKKEITGELLSGGRTTETINICRPIPFIVLKALAFDQRREAKDAYDLVYILQNIGSAELAAKVTPEELAAPSFVHASTVLSNHFQGPGQNGPVKCANFTNNAISAASAYAAVQDFVIAMRS